MDRRSVRVGARVQIVKKCDQQTGRLTDGVVEEILTNKQRHPRGIKVRLRDGTVGRVQNILSASADEQASISAEHYTGNERSAPCAAPSLADWITTAHVSRQPILDDIKIDDGGWACPACTFHNSIFLPSCEMCGTDRNI